MFHGGPEFAYASLDFTGRGYINQSDILNSAVMQHLPDQIDAEDVKLCFVMNNLFSENICQTSYDGKGPPSGTMNFDLFKKVFFNHLYLVQDDCQSNADRRALSIKNSLKHNSTQQPAIIEARINAMDKMIKMFF